MKTKIYSAIVLLGAAMASCSDNWEPNGVTPGGKGVGQVSIGTVSAVNSENIVSRAGVDVSNFIVAINNAQGEEVGSWKYGEMPELIALPVGEGYKVNVISHVQEKAAWDAPYFEGSSAPFAIAENKITNIEAISCRFSNIKVSIRFTAKMVEAMGEDCQVKVVANDEGSLIYVPGQTKIGYFQAIEGSSTLVATLTGTINGSYTEVQHTFADIEAGQHRIITYDIKKPNSTIPDETGYVDPATGISISFDVIDESVDGNVSAGEDILDDSDHPGKEDPIEPDPDPQNPPTPPTGDLVTFTSATIDFDNPNPAKEDGTEYVVTIKTVNPIMNLKVVINSETLTPEILSGVGLADQFDLAEPGQYEEGLKGLGFQTGNEVRGQKEVLFNITDFIPLLNIYGSATHKFILTVIDSEGNEVSKTLTFVS